MKSSRISAGILCALLALAGSSADAAAPTVHRRTLANGVRVCYLYVKGSQDFSMFTFLPLGLAADEPGHAQWAHLIEHLVVRTTVPGALAKANAETMPDHMRLDTYDAVADWRDGLRHHARWLAGEPFTDESVRVEPGRANGEAERAAERTTTHKFATAAWAQVVRYGATHVAVTGDIVGKDRAALEDYRDRHLAAGPVLAVAIGGVEPGQFLAAASESLCPARLVRPAAAVSRPVPAPAPKPLAPGPRRATWDVDAGHVLLTWPAPSPAKDARAYAALMVLGRLMSMDMSQDADFRKTFSMVFTGTDLRGPDGDYFYVSGGHRPQSEGATKTLADRVSRLLGTLDELPPAAVQQVAAQMAGEMDVSDLALARQAAPPEMTPKMIEMLAGMNWGMAEYRLGTQRAAVRAALQKVTVAELQRAAKDYLGDARRNSLELVPGSR